MSVGQNLGMFFGPPIVGGLIANGSWSAGVAPLVVSSAVGVVGSPVLQAKRARTSAAITA